jgi:hypothetical protein
MSDQILIAAPANPISVATTAEVDPTSAVPPLAHTPEQVRASDGVFTRDAHNAAGLFGLQSSILLLHAVAVDTFSPNEDESEEEREKGRKGEGET